MFFVFIVLGLFGLEVLFFFVGKGEEVIFNGEIERFLLNLKLFILFGYLEIFMFED